MADASPAMHPARTSAREAPSTLALLRESTWLGMLGFGGGVSVLGLIGHLAVQRKRWITDREFQNTATIAQMLPGGAAANALAHIGLRLRGLPGAIAAYSGFILPGAVMTLALAWIYTHFGFAPRAEIVLSGLNAAVVGIIAALALRMAESAIGRLWQMGVAAAALILSLVGGASSGEIAILGVCAGLVLDLVIKRARLERVRRAPHLAERSPPVALPDEGTPLASLREERAASKEERAAPGRPPLLGVLPPWLGPKLGFGALAALGVLFFRAGLGAYGGGFAIVPTLHAAAVGGGWIDERQFATAVAAGKLTPGPVLLMATFIGYVAHGFTGAAVATFAIFAAPFGLIVLLGGWLLRMRSRRTVRAALRGLTPAVVGLMAAAAVTLVSNLDGPADFAIAAASLLTLARFPVNPVAVLVVAGLARWGLLVLHLG